MSESPYPRNTVLSRPAFPGRINSPLSRPHFPWVTYLHRPSASPAPTGASANWDSASTVSNTSQTYIRNPSAIIPQYNEETNMRQWTFTVCLSLWLAYHRGASTDNGAWRLLNGQCEMFASSVTTLKGLRLRTLYKPLLSMDLQMAKTVLSLPSSRRPPLSVTESSNLK